MVKFCREHGIEHEVCGKVIVATEEKELPLLGDIYQRGVKNGLEVTKINANEVKEIEPHVNCLAGIRMPSAGIVDYRQVSLKFAELIEDHGGEIQLDTMVKGIASVRSRHVLETNNQTFEPRFLINCGGLHSDRIARLAKADPKANIIPFRGEYYELKPERRYLVNDLIYPVPDPSFPFLGVHFTRMVDGSVHAGPNSVLSFKKEGYEKTDFDLRDFTEVMTYPGFWRLAAKHAGEGIKEMMRSLNKAAFIRCLQKLIPEVHADDIVPTHAGVRAQALMKDGRLVDDFLIIKGDHSLHVCNAPSPAATSSIEIGKSIVDQTPNRV